MDRIKKLKIKKQDGTFSDYIPISADAEYIDMADGDNLQEEINTINNKIENELSKSEIYVGKEEPVANAQVWFKFGKNKFNKDAVFMSIGLNSLTGETMFVPALATTDFIEAYPNTFYTVNWEVDGGTNICYYTENKTFISSNISDKTFFTPPNCKYIRAAVFIDELNSQLQLEPGIKSTTYESYIEKTMYVKNKEVFEEFYNRENVNQESYSLREIRIGTWIDGKPLYRRVIQATTPTVTADGTSAWRHVEIQNVKFGRVADCQMLSNVANGTLLSPITRSTLSSGLNQFITVSFVNNTSNNTGVFQIESSSTTYNNRTVYAVIEYTKTTD